MKKLFIISHCENDVDHSISVFRTEGEACTYLKTCFDKGFSYPKDFSLGAESLVTLYHEWVWKENDNICENVVVLKVVELESGDNRSFLVDRIDALEEKLRIINECSVVEKKEKAVTEGDLPSALVEFLRNERMLDNFLYEVNRWDDEGYGCMHMPTTKGLAKMIESAFNWDTSKSGFAVWHDLWIRAINIDNKQNQ